MGLDGGGGERLCFVVASAHEEAQPPADNEEQRGQRPRRRHLARPGTLLNRQRSQRHKERIANLMEWAVRNGRRASLAKVRMAWGRISNGSGIPNGRLLPRARAMGRTHLSSKKLIIERAHCERQAGPRNN